MSSASRQPSENEILLPFEETRLHTEYKEYYRTKRNNFFATIQTFPDLWQCFQTLDDIWMREFRDLEQLRDSTKMLPAILFINAHAHFRIAMELAFSGCVGQAWNEIRSGIESVVHAHKIDREPHLGPVWSAKGHGPNEARAFEQAFEHDKKRSLFPAQYGLDKLHHFWSQFSELGTHTTVGAVGKSFASEESTTTVNWKLNYFETDLARLATYIFSLLVASQYMERAFFECFESRLKLDPELTMKRNEFDQRRERERRAIIKRFNVRPPPIWP